MSATSERTSFMKLNRPKNKILYFFYILFTVAVLIPFFFYCQKKDCNSGHVTSQLVSKTILLWTTFFGTTDYIKFESLGCKGPRCLFTSNREYLTKSDAVLFHLRDIKLNDLPAYRPKNQIWILLHHESPVHTPENILKKLNGLFNWTATYRYDSEILLSPVVEELPANAVTSRPIGFFNKTSMVAWLVSNCHTASKREDYVKELTKFIPVDIYGECGNLECLPKMSDGCYKKISEIYRYYLSFENSICKDYVTEKFFRILATDMIPVVLGGANYTAIAPPNSFIDTSSFKSPKDLAQFLLTLAKDPKRYRQYFDWRRSHRLVFDHYGCQLCRKLNENITQKVYLDVHDWWFADANCRSYIG